MLYNVVNPTSAVIGRLDRSLYNVVNATRAVATELVLPQINYPTLLNTTPRELMKP